MNRVLTANAYGDLGSLGNGAYVLQRQHNYPDTYDDRDVVWTVDHDRVDFSLARRCYEKHMKTGDMGLGRWAQTASKEKVIAFLADMMQEPKPRVPKPGVLPIEYIDADFDWTGFRVMGTVNRSNGYVVWSLQLFAKHPESDTKVYSGSHAPNVKGGARQNSWWRDRSEYG